jgi:hypothetical protein
MTRNAEDREEDGEDVFDCIQDLSGIIGESDLAPLI